MVYGLPHSFGVKGAIPKRCAQDPAPFPSQQNPTELQANTLSYMRATDYICR